MVKNSRTFVVSSTTDLKHLMAVTLEAREARKAAAVVAEVTSMESRAWCRVAPRHASSLAGCSRHELCRESVVSFLI